MQQPKHSKTTAVMALFAGVAAALLALELLFRVLPVSTSTATGYHFDPNILTYPAHHTFTVSTGWDLQNAHRHQSNNFGFLANHDFKVDPAAVAVIGDSFVESSMLDVHEQLATQLEAKLSGTAVYSMGGPGSSLLDYAERIRFAAERFSVKRFVVVVENGDIFQSLCGSGNIHAPCLDPATLEAKEDRQPSPGLAKRIFRHVALPQYVFSQLKLAPSDLSPMTWLQRLNPLRATPAPNSPRRDKKPQETERASQQVIEQFFARIGNIPRDKLILVLIGQTRTQDEGVATSIKQLIASADQHQATIVNAVPLIAAQGKATGLSMQVSPGDKHLNRFALAAIAKTLAAQLSASATVEHSATTTN